MHILFVPSFEPRKGEAQDSDRPGYEQLFSHFTLPKSEFLSGSFEYRGSLEIFPLCTFASVRY